MTTYVRHLHVRFGVAPSSVANCGLLGFFTEETVFVTKLNVITNFSYLSRVRKFPFLARHNRAKFVTHFKIDFRVTVPKRMLTIVLYLGRLAIKHLPLISINRNLIGSFVYGVHFRMIYIFMWSKWGGLICYEKFGKIRWTYQIDISEL